MNDADDAIERLQLKVVQIRVPAYMLDHLREYAKREGVSVTEFMRRAVVVRMRDMDDPA